jgi:hypothetical protein
MALMTVNDEGTADSRSSNRWSANKKLDVVLRLLRREKLEEVSWELVVEAHRLAACRDQFLDAGKEGLKGNVARLKWTEDSETPTARSASSPWRTKEGGRKRGSRCRRSGRGECGDEDSPGQGVRHHRCPEIRHLPPPVPGR